MAISSDYPAAVTVNGFSCKNCTDVGYAKKHIDPAHPKDGPFGINAKAHRPPADVDSGNRRDQAVSFGGQLAALISLGVLSSGAASSTMAPRLDIRA